VVAKLPASAVTPSRAEARKSKPTPRPPRTASPARPGSRFLRRAIFLVTAVAAGVAVVATFMRRSDTRPVETAKALAERMARPAAPAPKPAPSQPPSPPPTAAAPAEPPKPAAPAEPPPPPAQASPPIAVAPAEPPPKTKAEPPPPPPEEKPAPAEKAAPPETDARNPWKEPVPRALKPLRDRIVRGAKMSQKALTPLYSYAHDNPGDPRPWLLLGRAYGQLDWLSDSVERYVRAYHEDSSARGDPQMLADLVTAAANPSANRAAARAIRDIYGAEAILALEKEMARRAANREAVARLSRVRESLPR